MIIHSCAIATGQSITRNPVVNTDGRPALISKHANNEPFLQHTGTGEVSRIGKNHSATVVANWEKEGKCMR